MSGFARSSRRLQIPLRGSHELRHPCPLHGSRCARIGAAGRKHPAQPRRPVTQSFRVRTLRPGLGRGRWVIVAATRSALVSVTRRTLMRRRRVGERLARALPSPAGPCTIARTQCWRRTCSRDQSAIVPRSLDITHLPYCRLPAGARCAPAGPSTVGEAPPSSLGSRGCARHLTPHCPSSPPPAGFSLPSPPAEESLLVPLHPASEHYRTDLVTPRSTAGHTR